MGAAPPVRIRRAQPADAAAIGALVADALDEKVRPAFGDRGPQAVAALVSRDIHRPAVTYLVAVGGGEVVATARVALAQEASEGLRPLTREIGWWRTLRAAIVLGLLTHRRLDPDEAYVEEFAVRADHRRLGIGRRLLSACEVEARAAGKRRATLWVAAGNSPAIGLYRGCGYAVVSRRGTLRGRLVFHAPVALLMAKDLDTAG